MAYVSLFEVLRRSPGPSSTHTAGPYHAARRFVHELAATGRLPSVVRLGVELYGGAACAGRENGAAGALVAGLEGLAIDACDAASFASRLDDARTSRSVALDARHRLVFDPDTDIGFRVDRAPVYDGNAVRFAAFDRSGVALVDRAYLAAGDDRVVAPDEADSPSRASRVPYDYATAEDLLRHCRNAGRRIAVVALANEAALRAPAEVRARLGSLHDTMRGLVTRGLDPAPGDRARPRAAPRRAPRLDDPGASPAERCEILALAAAEENAAGASVVAAPSAGAGAVVAALLVHAVAPTAVGADARAVDFLATAGAIGALLRARGLRHAGCQGEVGVAAAMAAAGYAATLGGSAPQTLHAAELALKPHLGLGCDPRNGRVESPCIDRCVTAARRACEAAIVSVRDASPPVAIDAVAASMLQQARALAGRFKVESLGGLALSVPDC